MWATTIDGVIQAKVYTTLREACKAADVSYFSALRGKRIFKDCILTEVTLVKNKALKRDGFACLEVTRMANYKRDSSYDDDI